MALIYVTGIEAAGKTTVCKELIDRGYEAYDIDQGMAHFYNIITGKQATVASSAVKRTEAWYSQHVYRMDHTKVEHYRKKTKGKAVFLCGTTRSDYVVIDLFDEIVYLYLDEVTLIQRLRARKPFEFGSAAHERAMILGWRKPTEEDYRDFGATMINATKPLVEVIDEVIEKTIPKLTTEVGI